MTRTRRAIGAGLVGAVCCVSVVEVCLAPPAVPRQPGAAAQHVGRPASRPALPRVTSRPATERDAVLGRIEQRATTVSNFSALFLVARNKGNFPSTHTSLRFNEKAISHYF